MSNPTIRPVAAASLLAFGLILAACSADATSENAVADATEAAIESIDDSDITPEVLGETEESEDVEESGDADESGDAEEPGEGDESEEGVDFDEALEAVTNANAAAAEEAAAEEARLADEAAAAELEAEQVALDEQLDAEAEQFADGEAPDPEELETTNFAIVNVPLGLNLRIGPGTTFEVVTGVEADRVLTGTGIVDGNWTQVQIDGLTGWVPAEYLVETDAVDTPPVTEEVVLDEVGITETATTLTVVNVDVGVNIRNAPGLGGEIVGNALLGDTVTATGNSADGWTEIESNGVIGWASTDRLVAS